MRTDWRTNPRLRGKKVPVEGTAIAEDRHDLNLTQQAFAAAAPGVSREALSLVERTHEATRALVKKIADAIATQRWERSEHRHSSPDERNRWIALEAESLIERYTGTGRHNRDELLVPDRVEYRSLGVDPAPTTAEAADEYSTGTGCFRREGDIWKEHPEYAPGKHFTFQQLHVDQEYIYLYDESRRRDPASPMYVRIPIAGGIAQWSYPNPLQWEDLYVVAPRPLRYRLPPPPLIGIKDNEKTPSQLAIECREIGAPPARTGSAFLH